MKLKPRHYPFILRVLLTVAAGSYGVMLLFPPRLQAQQIQPSRATYSEVEPTLFMGGRVSEPPPGTVVVLNLCEVEDDYKVDEQLWKKIPDAAPAPSLQWLREAVGFVDKAQKAGRKTYVHCAAGISRAGMVVTAYEMFKHDWPRDKALEFVRSKRTQVNPNPAFMELLLKWEKELGMKTQR